MVPYEIESRLVASVAAGSPPNNDEEYFPLRYFPRP